MDQREPQEQSTTVATMRSMADRQTILGSEQSGRRASAVGERDTCMRCSCGRFVAPLLVTAPSQGYGVCSSGVLPLVARLSCCAVRCGVTLWLSPCSVVESLEAVGVVAWEGLSPLLHNLGLDQRSHHSCKRSRTIRTIRTTRELICVARVQVLGCESEDAVVLLLYAYLMRLWRRRSDDDDCLCYVSLRSGR